MPAPPQRENCKLVKDFWWTEILPKLDLGVSLFVHICITKAQATDSKGVLWTITTVCPITSPFL
jgi:hypothetical protein